MKLECHVIEVHDQFPELRIKLQDENCWKTQKIVIPSTKASRQSYYIGRKVIIEVTPA